MMNNVILCEGSTDYVLLQYYMRKAYRWCDDKDIQRNILKMPGQKSRNLKRGEDILTVMAVGGCSQIGNGLKQMLEELKQNGLDEVIAEKRRQFESWKKQQE